MWVTVFQMFQLATSVKRITAFYAHLWRLTILPQGPTLFVSTKSWLHKISYWALFYLIEPCQNPFCCHLSPHTFSSMSPKPFLWPTIILSLNVKAIGPMLVLCHEHGNSPSPWITLTFLGVGFKAEFHKWRGEEMGQDLGEPSVFWVKDQILCSFFFLLVLGKTLQMISCLRWNLCHI